jgi:hypothetical protein
MTATATKSSRVWWTRRNADGDTVVVLDTPSCPHCGNTDLTTIEDNGLTKGDAEYTRLCLRRVDAHQSSYDLASLAEQDVDSDGKVACGYQWTQDYEVYDADGALVGEFKNHG